MDIEPRQLLNVLRTAADLRPGNARRASAMPGYDAPQLARLLSELLSEGMVVGVPVAGPFGDDFIVAGLTREGGEFLAGIQNEQVWAIVRLLADDQWPSVTIQRLVTLALRGSRAATHRPLATASTLESRANNGVAKNGADWVANQGLEPGPKDYGSVGHSKPKDSPSYM
jgi:hypothetical protein